MVRWDNEVYSWPIFWWACPSRRKRHTKCNYSLYLQLLFRNIKSSWLHQAFGEEWIEINPSQNSIFCKTAIFKGYFGKSNEKYSDEVQLKEFLEKPILVPPRRQSLVRLRCSRWWFRNCKEETKPTTSGLVIKKTFWTGIHEASILKSRLR